MDSVGLTGHVWTSLDIVGQQCILQNKRSSSNGRLVRTNKSLQTNILDTFQHRPQSANSQLSPIYITVLDSVHISAVDHVEGNCIFPQLPERAVNRSLLCRHVSSGVTNTGRGFPHNPSQTLRQCPCLFHRRVLSRLLIYSWWRDY